MDKFEIRHHISIPESAREAVGRHRQPITQGWGIFKDYSGISTLGRSELVDVLNLDTEDREGAQRHADALTRIDGVLQREIEGDLESNVAYQESFSVGRVALTDTRLELRRVDTYERVEPQSPTQQ